MTDLDPLMKQALDPITDRATTRFGPHALTRAALAGPRGGTTPRQSSVARL